MSDIDRNRRTDAVARRAAALPDILAGKGSKEIAALHGVSESTVSRWMVETKQSLLQAERDAIAIAGDKLREGVEERLEELAALTRNKDAKVRLAAVNSWLDRAGIVKTERREHTGAGGAPLAITMSVEDTLAAAKRKEGGQ